MPQSFGEGTRDANRTSDNLRPLNLARMMRSGNGAAAYFSEAYPALKTYSTRSGTRFPPGASATAEGVNFSLFGRNANRVELLLYDAADSADPIQIISLDPDKNRSYFFWHVLVEGLPAGTHYTWRVDGGKELLDLWARAVTDSGFGFDGKQLAARKVGAIRFVGLSRQQVRFRLRNRQSSLA